MTIDHAAEQITGTELFLQFAESFIGGRVPAQLRPVPNCEQM
ncbi:hypothetical protein [Microcoleus sp. FACHB-672]|nr:hypothetical protein [Microcoleus sp. FACHB-672]